MKITVIVCAFLFVAMLPGMAQRSFTIEGDIKGRDICYICLGYLNENYEPVKDSAHITNGKFSWQGNIAEPCFTSIIGNSGSRSADNGDFTVFCLEPGILHISLVEDKYPEAVITGSKTQLEWMSMKKHGSAEETKQATIQFIRKHPASY